MSNTNLSDREMWSRMYAVSSDARFWPHPETRCSAFELERIYQAHLPKGPDVKLLEMGCGGSKWLPYFHKVYGHEVHGIDYTEVGCRSALANLEAAGGAGSIHCRDFMKLGDEFRSAYDIAISYGVVEHFERTDSILEIFADCLKPGGIMVTYVPNFAGIMGPLLKRLDRALYDTHVLFDVDHLARAHEACGLSIVHASYLEWADFTVLPVDVLPTPVALVLKNAFYALNRVKLLGYRRWGLDPQSAALCAAMIVLARKESPPAAHRA